MAILDCTGVESVSERYLPLLFSSMLPNGLSEEPFEMVDKDSLTATLAEQINRWLDQQTPLSESARSDYENVQEIVSSIQPGNLSLESLKPGVILSGSMFPEPVQVIVASAMGNSIRLTGKGLQTNQVYEPILTVAQLAQLEASPDREPFDGDPLRFRLGIEALRLGLAYEYEPFFALTIARVDPLPHQLEAVYNYFLKQPRIRFLLADDPGAGKTIMAGLLLKELKVRGLAQRTLIVAPANLTFQWQREMKDKFREDFEVVRGDVLRANYGMNPWQEKNQVVTSVSWISRVENAKDSLLRSHWDLIIVDEAHKMSAYSTDKKTLAYQLGESLSEIPARWMPLTAKKMVRTMIEQENDSVITVKANQKLLYQRVCAITQDCTHVSVFIQSDKTHHHRIQRTVEVFDCLAGIAQDWLGLRRLEPIRKPLEWEKQVGRRFEGLGYDELYRNCFRLSVA